MSVLGSAAAAGRRRLAKSSRARRAFNHLRYRSVESGDVLLVSYPKSGNTWLRFILAEILFGVPPDFDAIDGLVPQVGAHGAASRMLPGGGRLLKSHEARSSISLSPGTKAVYVIRDGRDVAASYYYGRLRRGHFEGSFSAFLDEFLAGRLDGYGTWSEHVRSWCEGSSDASLCLVRYEDILADPHAEVTRVLGFLGLDVSPETVDSAIERNAASNMRAKEAGSKLRSLSKRDDISFVRAGRAGTWMDLFEPQHLEAFELASGHALALGGYEYGGSRG